MENNNKRTLILLTTAITRNSLHKQSIGIFYKELYGCLIKDYNIIHIINIDFPLKLRNVKEKCDNDCDELERNKFDPQKTRELLDELIPDDVNKIFIIKSDDTPTFAKAYKKVIKCVHDNEFLVLYENSIVWWLEDDWTFTRFYNFIPLLKLMGDEVNEKCAFSITDKAPLCSFRAGPIMSSSFFETYFDIHDKISDNKDPEYKVGRNIRYNETVKIQESDILIICLFIHSLIKPPYTMIPSCYWWYSEKMRSICFKKNYGIKFMLAVMETPSSNLIHYKKSLNANTLRLDDIDAYKQNEFVKCPLKQFKAMKSSNSLNYITIVPHLFEDIGRNFNKENNIQKP
jgi:hypothetical protein